MNSGSDLPLVAPLRLAELVAALSLASDLGTGSPMEHALRTCLLSLELARRSGVAADQLADVYYLSLLRFVGCTADAADTAADVGGDDIAFIAAMGPMFMGSTGEQMRTIVRHTGSDLALPRRIAAVAAVLADTKGAERSISAHCEAAQLLATRLGVGNRVIDALELSFERWDGKGIPGRAAGDDVPAPVRVSIVARDIDLWVRSAGIQAAVAMVRARSHKAYDPAVAAAFMQEPVAVLAAATPTDVWAATLAAEPAPWRRVPEQQLDAALGAFADFTDLKSPWLRGHSRGVAALAAGAARVAGLDEAQGTAIRWAGLLHDIGRVGVPNGVWDQPGPLGLEAWERVRLHPYLTERVMSRSRRLASLARLASCHHERSDRSGYHRGANAAEMSTAERLLAAADAYHAMTEDRPHRRALSPDAARDELRRGAFEDADIEAVTVAAGHEPRPTDNRRLAGLTDREVEILRLIARGRSNRQVAAQLVISPKTVGSHVEHIYTKTGVTTRAGAALFAMEHGLLAPRTASTEIR